MTSLATLTLAVLAVAFVVSAFATGHAGASRLTSRGRAYVRVGLLLGAVAAGLSAVTCLQW